MKTNIILNGDALIHLKEFPNESINCVMTSPPYWALRDYGISVETIWDGKETCEHEWEIGKAAGDPRIKKRSESRAGWERPSREEFANRDNKMVCPVCNKEFEGKPNQKFCSIECLNTLSNSERTSYIQNSNFCIKCGAWKGQLGLEPTFELYIKHLCDIFDEVKRVLRKDGTCWVNLGDTYSATRWTNNTDSGQPMNNFKDGYRGINPEKITGLEDKNLTLIPFRFAIEMQNRGWILRNVIIWHKPNVMPSSVKDRFTVDFEYLFFFVKSKKYFFETQYEKAEVGYNDLDFRPISDKDKQNVVSIKTSATGASMNRENKFIQTRNKRAVWKITTKPFKEAHFAVYPKELCETPIKAGCPEFVCNKCGRPREGIIEKEYINQRISENEKYSPSNKMFGTNVTYGRGKLIIKNKGYISCSCNAGFSGGIVLDPFFGSGTTGLVALKQNKQFIGIELNKEYIEIANKRLKPYLEQEKLI